MREVTDRIGNALHIGDFVCFVANSATGWRQGANLVRARVESIDYGKDALTDWIRVENFAGKISPKRTYKCY